MNNFDQVCPGGNIAAQLYPNPPEPILNESCQYCGRDVDDCECDICKDCGERIRPVDVDKTMTCPECVRENERTDNES
jgi:hypothetical protein